MPSFSRSHLGSRKKGSRKQGVQSLVSPLVDVIWSPLDPYSLGWIWFGLETSSHIV